MPVFYLLLWANAGFKPMLSTSIQLKHADGRTYLTGRVCRDLCIQQIPNCLDRSTLFEKKIRGGNLGLNDSSKTARRITVASGGAVHWLIDVSSKHVVCDGAGREVYLPFLVSEECHGEVHGMSGKEKNCSRCIKESILKLVRTSLGITTGCAGRFGDIEKIDLGGGVVPVSSKDKISVRGTQADLANVWAGHSKPFVVTKSRSAVSANDNRVLFLQDKENRGEAAMPGKGEAKSKPDRPRYMRYQTTGGIDTGIFYEGFRHALSLDYLDVDVSTDGKTWLHAFGPTCISHLGNYNTE